MPGENAVGDRADSFRRYQLELFSGVDFGSPANDLDFRFVNALPKARPPDSDWRYRSMSNLTVRKNPVNQVCLALCAIS